MCAHGSHIIYALYKFCNPEENISYWHSASTFLKDLVVILTKQGSLRVLYPKEELFITLCRRGQTRLLEEHLAHLCRVSQNLLLFISGSVYQTLHMLNDMLKAMNMGRLIGTYIVHTTIFIMPVKVFLEG